MQQEKITAMRPISIAVLALGGEGGGVLADWIVDLAEHGGHLVQATSVPGVAQRTGATIYYLELFPKAAAQKAGRDPVLALMPVPGDVAVVLASELMEAARAIQRGFVTPDRTLLIASTHRIFAMTEKMALADGRVDSATLLQGCEEAARRLVAFDMAAIAEATQSQVSAVLFGALAGSGALPFQRMAFEAAIRRGGVGVSGSLAAFAAGYEAARTGTVMVPAPAAIGQKTGAPGAEAMLAEAEARLGKPELPLVRAGIERLVDYQDAAYARDYLDRLVRFADLEQSHGDGSRRLIAEVARQLALAMSYEDTIRVAELKIRATRFERVRQEVSVKDGQILEIAEFFHPRVEEIADTLPAGLGRWLLRTAWARNLLGRFTRAGRVVKTTSIAGFGLLYLLWRMKPTRRRSLRFGVEQAERARWLDAVANVARVDYALAVELARARTLVKGYGDTHARGREKFERLMALLPRLAGRPDAGAIFSGFITAALADEAGLALGKAVATFEQAAKLAAPGDAPAPQPHG